MFLLKRPTFTKIKKKSRKDINLVYNVEKAVMVPNIIIRKISFH